MFLPSRLDAGLRLMAPFATALLAAVLDLLPLPDAGPDVVTPHLTLIVVFYWAVSRPELMSAWVIFLIGLLRDLAAGLPVGMGSLSLLLVPLVLRETPLAGLRRWGLGSWAVFALVAFLVGIARWLIGTAFWEHALALRPFLTEIALTVLVYPAIAWLLGLLEPLLKGGGRASGG